MKIKRKFQVLVAICMVVILNWIPVQSVSSVVQAAAAKPVVVLQTSQIVLKAGSGNVNAAASIVIPVTLDIPTGMTFGGALVDVQFNPSVLDATTCTADSSFTIGLCSCNPCRICSSGITSDSSGNPQCPSRRSSSPPSCSRRCDHRCFLPSAR